MLPYTAQRVPALAAAADVPDCPGCSCAIRVGAAASHAMPHLLMSNSGCQLAAQLACTSTRVGKCGVHIDTCGQVRGALQHMCPSAVVTRLPSMHINTCGQVQGALRHMCPSAGCTSTHVSKCGGQQAAQPACTSTRVGKCGAHFNTCVQVRGSTGCPAGMHIDTCGQVRGALQHMCPSAGCTSTHVSKCRVSSTHVSKCGGQQAAQPVCRMCRWRQARCSGSPVRHWAFCALHPLPPSASSDFQQPDQPNGAATKS